MVTPIRLQRWWLNRSVRVKGLIVLTLPMLAFITVTSAALVLQLEERSERQVAISASNLRNSANQLLADAVNAETGVRGYAGTGDALFLEPYLTTQQRAAGDLAALRSAGVAEGQQSAVSTVSTAFNAELDQLARLRRSVRANIAPTQDVSVGLGAGKVIMDRLRREVADLATEPTKLASRKRASIDRLENVITSVELSGLLFGTLAALAGLALFTSGISRRVRVAADNAGRLGRGTNLLVVEHGGDELGQLERSLLRAERLLVARLHELSAARDQAMLSTDAKSTFLSRTSHELRTPLNAMLGFAQLIAMSELTPDDRESVNHILAAGKHLLELINELIDTASVEAGDLKLSMRPVFVADLTEQVIGLIGPLAAARSITIEHRPADQPLAVVADERRLRQVLVNLASNAVKYTHHGGVITIEGRLIDSETVELNVADTGPGITPSDIERIFIPFERLNADQYGIEGSGMGLPLALAMTNAMHGTLDVVSVVGIGSTFTVRLARADSDLAIAAGAQPVVTRPGRFPAGPDSSPVVLSIEDNDTNALVIERYVEHEQLATLFAARSGHAGLALARTLPIDLILLDLRLPDLTGEEVLARLHADARTAGIPVVIVSANANPHTVRALRDQGATGYLTKPVDLGKLRELIEQTAVRPRSDSSELEPAVAATTKAGSADTGVERR